MNNREIKLICSLSGLQESKAGTALASRLDPMSTVILDTLIIARILNIFFYEIQRLIAMRTTADDWTAS